MKIRAPSAADEPRYLTTAQVAQRFHVTANAVRGWRRDGKPPHGWVKVGRQQLLPLERLAVYEHTLIDHNESS